MCGLGRLYSKQNVIEKLLEKEGMPSSCDHIKSLKDIKDLKLTANPAYSAEDDKNAPFICSLIGLEMSGQFRFVALWTCGCVFSERALKQLKSNVCSICQLPYTEQDVVFLNGNSEDVAIMKSRMEARTAQLKAEKKDKKNKIKVERNETISASLAVIDCPKKILKSPATEMGPSTSKILSKASFVAKSTTNASQKRQIITDLIGSDPNSKKSKKDYSIATDEKATEVYKSIFTSHESEQTQQRGHWVTYNPFYN